MSSSSFNTPKRYSPNSFFAMAKQVDAAVPQSCSQAIITGTPKRIYPQQQQKMRTNGNSSESGEITNVQQQRLKKRQTRPQHQQQQYSINNGFSSQTQHCGMAACLFATPQRNAVALHHQHLRREHSASAILIPKRNFHGGPPFARYTPPARFFDEDHEVSTVFAASKFIESPSAKSLPLPPSHWLEERRKQKEADVKEEDEEDSDERLHGNAAEAESGNGSGHASSTDTNESVNYVLPGSWSPPTASATKSPVNGIRIHPLHLIAAAVMST